MNPTIAVVEETLSDGSKVYSIVTRQNDHTVIYDCVDEKAANKLYEKIEQLCVNVTAA